MHLQSSNRLSTRLALGTILDSNRSPDPSAQCLFDYFWPYLSIWYRAKQYQSSIVFLLHRPMSCLNSSVLARYHARALSFIRFKITDYTSLRLDPFHAPAPQTIPSQIIQSRLFSMCEQQHPHHAPAAFPSSRHEIPRCRGKSQSEPQAA